MKRLSRVLAGAAALVASAVTLVSCRSISKEEIERTLLALPKNAPLRADGVRSLPVTMTLDGRTVSAEVRYVRVPRQLPLAGLAPQPIVLVHGTPGSFSTWTELVLGKDGAPGLALEHDVYMIDVLGHGTTRTEDRPVTFQKCSEWVRGAVRALGVGPVHLVGQSYGGEFCWRAAADEPALFRSLTLLDSAGYRRPDDGWLPEETAMREMWLAPIGYAVLDREKMRGALQLHYPFQISADHVEEYFVVSANAANWKAMVDLCRDENGTREADIAKVSVPTLLLWGADDIAYPVARDAERFARDVRGSRLVVLPGCGHYPHETFPGKVAEEIRALLRANP